MPPQTFKPIIFKQNYILGSHNYISFPIPFFVVDRPISLKILEFCELEKLPFRVGLMGHAKVSKNFQKLFREFGGKNVIKAVDSGVFNKDGCKLDYNDLFDTYESMGAQYGIIIDILRDKDRTLKSAEEGIKRYRAKDYRFKLVGVAQGNNLEEYLECYKELKDMGYNYIAIGGLLKKIENSARYVKVADESFMEEVVKKIREKYPKDWLFLLGCFNPKRIDLFRKYQIFGADYKGWIFMYNIPSQDERDFLTKEELKEKRFIEIKRRIYSKVFSKYFYFKKTLILVSCSKKKRKGKATAIYLYNGPFFKQLRKVLSNPYIDILIISAKYGAIDAFDIIEDYDLRMNKNRAEELRESARKKIENKINENDYDKVIVNLGSDYITVLNPWFEELILNRDIEKIFLSGKIGERASMMKKLLELEKRC